MMVPNNVQKFQYTDIQRENFQNLSHKALDNNLIICPSQKSFYTWNIPEDSPDSDFGCWSSLIRPTRITEDSNHIRVQFANKTLWNRNVNNDIKEIVINKEDLYYVPMNQVYYTNIHNHNHTMYVQDNNINYLIDFDNIANLFKVSQNRDIGIMYNLSTNENINYALEEAQKLWSELDPIDVQDEGGWNVCYTTQDDFDETNEIMKLINETYESEKEDDDQQENHETGEINSNLVYDNEPDTMEYKETSDTDDDEDDEGDYTDEDYTDVDEDEDYTDHDEDEDNTDVDDLRNVAEGIPVDVKDNLPDWDEEEEERMDHTDGIYYTKREFKEYYGDNKMWKAMHPKKKLRRYALYYANYYASHLSLELRQKFIKEYLKTF